MEGEERREVARGVKSVVRRVGVGGGRWKRESWRSEWERRAREARIDSRAKGSMGEGTGMGVGGGLGEESMMEMMGEKERRTGKERLINKDVKSDATWDQPPS